MCLAIYAALIGLFVLYSDHVIEQYALSLNTGGVEHVVVAIGWEMVLWLWPLLLAAMMAASAVSVWATRRAMARRKTPSASPRP
ncbi:MAG: hypothetical protein WCZ20_06940 [Hydrogenophaga sp.]